MADLRGHGGIPHNIFVVRRCKETVSHFKQLECEKMHLRHYIIYILNQISSFAISNIKMHNTCSLLLYILVAHSDITDIFDRHPHPKKLMLCCPYHS